MFSLFGVLLSGNVAMMIDEMSMYIFVFKSAVELITYYVFFTLAWQSLLDSPILYLVTGSLCGTSEEQGDQ